MDLTLKNIEQGLEDNLTALQQASMGRYLHHDELIATDPTRNWQVDYGGREMSEMRWRVYHTGISLGLYDTSMPDDFPDHPGLRVHCMLYRGLEAAHQQFLDWKAADLPGFFVRLAYDTSERYRKRTDQRRETAIKRILSWQCFFDAYIVFRHTGEFGEALRGVEDPRELAAIDGNAVGYHEQGIINANLMGLIRRMFKIQVSFEKLSKAVRH